MNPQTSSTIDRRAEITELYEGLRPKLELLRRIAEIADELDRGRGERSEHFEQLRSLLDRVPAVFGPESARLIQWLHADSGLERISRGREFVALGGTEFLRWSFQLIGDAEELPGEPEGIILRERCWMVLDSYDQALEGKASLVAAVYRSM